MYLKTVALALLLICVTASSLAAQAFELPAMSFAFAEQRDEARELWNSGVALFDSGKYTEAAERFKDIQKKHARSAVGDRSSYMLMRTLVKLRKTDEALALANAFPKTYPRSPWMDDVRQLRMSLTNEIPADVVLGATPAARAAQAAAQPPQPPQAPLPPATTPRPGLSGLAPGAMIGGRGGPRAEENPETRLQQEALRVLFENNPDRAIEIATDRLKSDPTDVVILSSLHMVANSRSEKAIPMLVMLAKTSPDSRSRRDAIQWIGRARGEKDALADILVGLVPSMTGDEDSSAIAYALGQVNTPKAYDALSGMARDKNRPEKLRMEAVRSIGVARIANRVSMLEEIYKANMDNSRIRRQVVSHLVSAKEPQVVTALVTVATSDPDTSVRISAVNAIGQIKTPEAIKALEDLLKKK
jgi:hypothetical protein